MNAKKPYILKSGETIQEYTFGDDDRGVIASDIITQNIPKKDGDSFDKHMVVVEHDDFDIQTIVLLTPGQFTKLIDIQNKVGLIGRRFYTKS